MLSNGNISLFSFQDPEVSFEKDKAFFFFFKKENKNPTITLNSKAETEPLFSGPAEATRRNPIWNAHTLCTSLCWLHEGIWRNDDVVVERRDGSRGTLEMSFSVDPAHLSSVCFCHRCISPPTGIKSYDTTEAP